jgi:hypothetical protein
MFFSRRAVESGEEKGQLKRITGRFTTFLWNVTYFFISTLEKETNKNGSNTRYTIYIMLSPASFQLNLKSAIEAFKKATWDSEMFENF